MFARRYPSASSSSPSVLVVVGAYSQPNTPAAAGYAGAFALSAAGGGGIMLPWRPRGRRLPPPRWPSPIRSSRHAVVVSTSASRYLDLRSPACVSRRLGISPSVSATTASYSSSSSSSSNADDGVDGVALDESARLSPPTGGTKGTTESGGGATRITASDRAYMNLALERARLGFGYTYPNPAVGCVLVRSSSSSTSTSTSTPPNSDEGRGSSREDEGVVREGVLDGDVVIGTGFHPRAGMPHAEVFALLEACGAVTNGTAAAASVMEARRPSSPPSDDMKVVAAMRTEVERLASEYSSEGGAERLLSGCCRRDHLSSSSSSSDDDTSGTVVTAYVTLEPCCHTGKTPPCATSLIHAGVDRVVVGYGDPNPRVDGGGVKLLRDAGVTVDLMSMANDEDVDGEEARAIVDACAGIVECFVKRITRDEVDYDYSVVTGRHRSALRSLAGRRKAQRTLPEISLLAGDTIISQTTASVDEGYSQGSQAAVDVDSIFDSIPGWWLEEVDTRLWSDELVLLRLGDVTPRKKLAKRLGTRIASEHLGAHVARTLGHTVLLYRPGSPPVLDLEELAASDVKSKT